MNFGETEEFGTVEVEVEGGGRPNQHGAADWQFYPTPEALADRAWAKFGDKRVERLLDACAGTGALADAYVRRQNRHRYATADVKCIDTVEIDARHHPTLREKGFQIVGFDFLGMDAAAGAIYSHIIMNPPFNQGAKCVLKGFSMLWEGELVAILNAETIRNPINTERRQLVKLIEQFGEVEFIEEAFQGEGVEREANVEIALIHLVKQPECNLDWIGPVIDGLSKDSAPDEAFRLPNELALPASFVQNQCIAFRQAVKAMRESVRMGAVARHFANRVGLTLAQHNREEGALRNAPVDETSVRTSLRNGYLELKDRAWASILRSTETLSRLSQKVQKQAESQFNDIKQLEFTEANVYGFLLGLVESQPEMQVEMACDVFDQVTRYHSDNAVYYRGWKSNDKHRTAGKRMKTTRFILPNNGSYSHSLCWEAEQRLADIDKVFRMLDGKPIAPPAGGVDMGLRAAFGKHWTALQQGERIVTEYFDVRFYKGIGTIHFFPTNKTLVDRLNKMVGRRRQWLPPNVEAETPNFWKAYESAEKLDKKVRDEVKRLRKAEGRCGYWDDPFNEFEREESPEGHAVKRMNEAIDNVLREQKLLDALEHEEAKASALEGGRPGQLALELSQPS